MSTKNKQEPITYVAGLVSNCNTCNDELYVDEACVFNVKTVNYGNEGHLKNLHQSLRQKEKILFQHFVRLQYRAIHTLK